MKKILAIILTLCMMTSLFCISIFASDEPAAGTVLRVSAQKKDGKIVKIKDYKIFDDGWNAAMELADNSSEMKKNSYDRVVVDLYADWNAVDGQFTDDFGNGSGFDWDAIYIQDGVKITLNMNGHTINRGLTYADLNGEVICIDEDADVIINNGTITGGFSFNGAGGIHIKDNANVTLNNVHIVGNTAENDDGGGIAVYDGATLTVNGGSFKNNLIDGIANKSTDHYGGGVYVEDSTAFFYGVEFKNNYADGFVCLGMAIYAANSNVTIEECTFDGNGYEDDRCEQTDIPRSIVHADESTVVIRGSDFINNYTATYNDSGTYPSILTLDNSKLMMEKSESKNNKFSNNEGYFLIKDTDDSSIYVSDTDFVDNKASVLYGDGQTSSDSYFKNCTFKNNVSEDHVSFYDVDTTLTFFDCDMGDSTFDDKTYLKFEFSDISREEAVLGVSILNEDGTLSFVNYYKIFDDGWNAAMELADLMKNNSAVRVVVDLYKDWKAVEGEFTDNFNNGSGFNWDAIYFQNGVRMTLNMNGHTIDRGLTEYQYNGEVMYIDTGADIIINDGTIKGGWSCNSAGGIHINDDARVTLNDVHVDGNVVEDDEGAAIAVYDGAILIMNGGSASNNILYDSKALDGLCKGTIYVEDSMAYLTNVEIANNQARGVSSLNGVAVYADESTVTMEKCKIFNNGVMGGAPDHYNSKSTIHAVSSEMVIKETEFKGNGTNDLARESKGGKNGDGVPYLIIIDDSRLEMENCQITANAPRELFLFEDGEALITNCIMTDNTSRVMFVDNDGEKVELVKCTVGNNQSLIDSDKADIRVKNANTLVLTECEMRDTSIEDESKVSLAGSLFGAGSLSMIVSILALVASAAAIGVSVVLNKKKTVPAVANETAAETANETKTEENEE